MRKVRYGNDCTPLTFHAYRILHNGKWVGQHRTEGTGITYCTANTVIAYEFKSSVRNHLLLSDRKACVSHHMLHFSPCLCFSCNSIIFLFLSSIVQRKTDKNVFIGSSKGQCHTNVYHVSAQAHTLHLN
jgi:hypothetical protein